MKIETKLAVALLSTWLLSGCGAPEMGAGSGPATEEPVGIQEQAAVAFPSDAIRLALVHVRSFGGDPGTTLIQVKLEVDDAALRRAYPDFDGMESAYVDIPVQVPGYESRYPLSFLRAEGDADVYYWSRYFTSGIVDVGWSKPYVFGLSTNVGHFHAVAKGVRTQEPISEFE